MKAWADDGGTFPTHRRAHHPPAASGYPGGEILGVFLRDVPAHETTEDKIYNESQSLTGGEFANWHYNLTAKEKETYRRIYGH